MKYRPKAVEAIQFTEPNRYGVMVNAWGEGFREWCNFKDGTPDVLLLGPPGQPKVEVQLGTWLVFQGLVWWPLSPGEFAALYEPVPVKKAKA